MRKIILVIFILTLLLDVALAENKVFIVDLNYKDGIITVNDIMIKIGYYPDRKLQPEIGYTLELVSEDKVLYSFKFEVPLEIRTDVIDEDGEVKGGIIVLSETNFALILPYYDEAKEIRVYDSKNKEVLSKAVVPALGERTTLKWIFGFILIIIVLFLFFNKRPKKIIGVVR